MLNEEKIKYMTKAASYEKRAEHKNIEIGNFYRTDYIGLQMIKSALAYTASFAALAALWASGRMEKLMLGISRKEYLNRLLLLGGTLFLAGLLVYEIATWIYFTRKYREAKESVAKYNGYLKHIRGFYQEQGTGEIPAAVAEKEKTDEERT